MTEGVRPRGWYLASDVGQLVGVSAKTIGQWTRYGYVKATRDPGPPEVFSFQDVAEAMVVHELLGRGVPRPEIRTAVQNAQREYPNWPLTLAPIGVFQGEKGARMALVRKDGTYDVGRAAGYQKFLPNLEKLSELVSLLRRGGWVIKQYPKITHIEVDPDRLSGRPAIRGRRVLVSQVAAIASEAEGRRELRRDYELTAAEINDAVKWWDATVELRVAA
jgi:uncharacterized protein (DUF433 family)